MHQSHRLCYFPKHSAPPWRPLDPDSCPCQAASAEDKSEIKDAQDVVEIRHWSMLTPKASVEIVEKPEVENIEIAIFLERIVSLFGRVMRKLELAAALPILLTDPETSCILTASEMKKIEAALIIQDPQRESSKNLRDYASSKDLRDQAGSRTSLRSFDESPDDSVSTCSSQVSNSKIYEAIEVLNSYPAIREMVKSSRRKIAPQCQLFLQHMKYYVEHCVLRIRSTPLQAKMREIHFRSLWRENHKALKDIAALTRSLEAQRSSHHDQMKTIDSNYRKDKDSIDRLNRKCAEDIRSTVNRSEKKQVIEFKSSEIRQNDLRQYLALANNRLETLRESNLRMEQDIRNKRFKVSSQLAGQIAKYDAEVGARDRILQQLGDEFEADGRRKEELEEEMAKQKVIYDAFVEERETKILTIFREKLEKFVRTRAAKIIQRWWRPIFKRLRLKRKKMKKKGKKKKKK